MSTWQKLSTATTLQLVQESTHHSPFEVMFGRKGNLPIDFNIHATYDADAKLQEFAGNLNFQISVYIHILDMLHDHLVNLLLQAEGDAEAQEKRRDMEADVKTNVENAQRKQKLYYDQ